MPGQKQKKGLLLEGCLARLQNGIHYRFFIFSLIPTISRAQTKYEKAIFADGC